LRGCGDDPVELNAGAGQQFAILLPEKHATFLF